MKCGLGWSGRTSSCGSSNGIVRARSLELKGIGVGGVKSERGFTKNKCASGTTGWRTCTCCTSWAINDKGIQCRPVFCHDDPVIGQSRSSRNAGCNAPTFILHRTTGWCRNLRRASSWTKINILAECTRKNSLNGSERGSLIFHGKRFLKIKRIGLYDVIFLSFCQTEKTPEYLF